MSHIYFHKPFSSNSNGTNLSEAELYSLCSAYGNFTGYGASEGAATAENTLDYCVINGIIDDACLPYPSSSPYYTQPCSQCASPDQIIQIPGYEQLSLSSNQQLKRAIIDYGPIVVSAQSIGGVLHSGGGTTNHSFLIIGWNSSGQWHIKDSWPGDEYIDYKSFNVFSSTYGSQFYRAKYKNDGSTISCTGTGCNSVFSSRVATDRDGDGFGYWGVGDPPSTWSGPCKMDFDDFDNTKIYLDSNYEEVVAPSVSGPDLVCTSGGTFNLNDLPSGFSSSWSISNPTFFNSPTSGSGPSATISPKSEYSGDDCIITYTISDGCGSAQYSKHFTINGPADSDLNINVVPSYAPDPIRVSGIWLLCPNSSYYIYCNNTSNCSLSNYQWSYPSGWTKYEQTSNYIRINTNSTPYGTVSVTATTCCGTSHQVITQNFSQGGACSYYSAYPNPVTTELTIEFDEEFDMTTVDASTTLEVFDSGFSKKYKAEKIEKKIKIKTSSWKEGFYYVILNYKGQNYYKKIKVE